QDNVGRQQIGRGCALCVILQNCRRAVCVDILCRLSANVMPLTVSSGDNIIRDVRTFTAVVERDSETKLFVGYIPGFAVAHSQGATLDELQGNLREVVAMLLEDGEP